MKLVTYCKNEGDARLGVIQDKYIIDVERFSHRVNLELPSTMLEFIDLGLKAIESLNEALENSNQIKDIYTEIFVPAMSAKILAPIPRPRKNIFGIE